MPRLQIGIVRYGSVALAIGQALGLDPPPECRIGQARITLTLRRVGATRWPEARQLDFALEIARVARKVLADDPRKAVRKRAATRAIVVIYEDAADVGGCAVVAQWKCVVPA